MTWTCPTCNKELQAQGNHMKTHEEAEELTEEVEDEVVEEIEEEVEDEEIEENTPDSEIEEIVEISTDEDETITEKLECICPDLSITRDCAIHGEFMVCPYCQADQSIIYVDYTDPICQPKCEICGKVWAVNMIEPGIAWTS